MTQRRRSAVTIIVVVAAMITVALAARPVRRAYGEAILRRNLIRLADLGAAHANVRSRLSMSPVPRRVEMRSGTANREPAELHTAAAAVLEGVKRLDNPIDDPSALRASAAAHYYSGDYGRAARELERVAGLSADAMTWNDLAAARLELSRYNDAAYGLLPALVAVEEALAIEPTLPPALYNRAAILEQMGLRRHAREAWRVARVAESDPRWRSDVVRRMGDLESDIDQSAAPKILASLRPEQSRDIQNAVERFPQDARRYTETVLPVEWAAAVLKGDTATANDKLRLARALATALLDHSGETLAYEAIVTIDAAMNSGQSERIRDLADAYTKYGEARALLRAHDFATAEAKLKTAAEHLAHAGNPMANVARYNAATAILQQNRADEAAALYASLMRAERSNLGHRGLTAQLAWHLATTEGIRGHWDAAIDAARMAVDGFRALGEAQNTGFMENMLAELYDYLGQPERAWEHRLIAFDLLSATGSARQLQVSIGAAARERVRRKDWRAAIALLHLEIAESRRAAQAVLLADALTRRARARASGGDFAGARQDAVAARTALLQVRHPHERAQVIAAIDAAEGFAEQERNPSQSVRLFTSAIEFYERSSKIFLPELYLERGRSNLALGAEVQALEDFSNGIDRLEEQRATLSDYELHTTVADAGEALYVEAVRLAVRRGEVERAYAFSERSRGRAVAMRLAPGNAPSPVQAPADTRIVELMMLPDKLIVFTIDQQLRMTEIDIGREQIERMVASLVRKMQDSPVEAVKRAAADLYDAILRPLGVVTDGVSTLVVVPGGVLQQVPWAALFDRERKRYLIEDVPVVSAPSAALYALTPSASVKRAPRVLIVGNPKIASASIDLPALRGAEAEARAIAGYYPARTLLLGPEATIERVRYEAERATVLHFAGHAVSSERLEEQSFLVLAEGMLYSRDIASLDLSGLSLVVLAACGTIRGSTFHVDGMPSIGRSFLAGGAKAVIGTLWDVDDQRVSALFARVHRDMAGGAPVAHTVRDAQLEAIRSSDPATAHPRTWGGLVLMSRR